MNQPSALVTGATGFIGSHLTRALLASGWQVHAVLRPDSRTELIDDLIQHPSLRIHRVSGSFEELKQVAEQSRAQACFHLAALFVAHHAPEHIPGLVRDNLLFSTLLTEALVAARVPTLVNAGTSWQHFESKSYSPVSLYAATKQAFEDLLRFYTETTPLKAVTLKLFDSFGPGDRRKKIFALLKDAAENGTPLEMTGGEQYIDLVYIDDVVRAFLRAEQLLREPGAKSASYAVSSGHPIQVKKLVEVFGQATGLKPQVVLGKRPYRPREMMGPWNAGPTLPGWAPTVTLEQGIRRIYGG
jgi:nucleoside-diphosphate-sugar epimerase